MSRLAHCRTKAILSRVLKILINDLKSAKTSIFCVLRKVNLGLLLYCASVLVFIIHCTTIYHQQLTPPFSRILDEQKEKRVEPIPGYLFSLHYLQLLFIPHCLIRSNFSLIVVNIWPFLCNS